MSDDGSDISADADEVLAILEALAAAEGPGLISARQDASEMLVSTGPDVLYTPDAGNAPVPYPVVTAPLDPSAWLSMSVRNNGDYDFQLNSRTTTIQGHHRGSNKGVKVRGYEKYSHVMVASDFVFSEGFATVAHMQEAWINHPERGPEEPRKPKTEVKI